MQGSITQSSILGADGKPFVRASVPTSLRARYDAAQTTANNRKHWSAADLMSAREANSPQVRQTLRSRSRYECHEANSFASGIVGTLANDVIGRGPRLQIAGMNTNAKRSIELRWKQWSKRVRLARTLQTAMRSLVVDGEAFANSITNQRSKDEVKLDVRLTEADQIAAPWGLGDWFEDPSYVDGIKLDDQGNPVIYHRLKGHPGDTFRLQNHNEKDDIPADDMIHLFRRDRPGQFRGVPWMTTALPLFAVLRRYTLAVLASAESVASFGGVIYTDSPQAAPADVDVFDQVELEMRSFLTLPEGWKMGQLKAEQPTTVFEMFRNAILMEIARCVHMPLNKVLGSSAKMNYASGRMDHQVYHGFVKVLRDMFEIEALDTIFEWWLDEALLIPGYLDSIPSVRYGIDHTWMWDEPEHVDPGKVANATAVLWNLGLVSDEEFQMGRGVDPDEHDARMKRQMERRIKLGLPIPGGMPGQQASGSGDDTDEEEIEEEEEETADV